MRKKGTNLIGMLKMTAVYFAIAVLVASPLGCGGGSSDDDGGSTFTLMGFVFDPELEAGIGSATVTVYRASDSSAVAATTSASTGSVGLFSISGIPESVEVYLNATKSSYISGNTRTGILTSDATDVMIYMLLESSAFALEFANAITGENEPAMNSTMQSYCYLVMEAEDDIGDDLAGLTVTAPNVSIQYASNMADGSGTLHTAPPTMVRAYTNELPMMAGCADSADAGIITFTGSVAVILEETSINAPLAPGELTYFTWYEED